MRVSQVEKAIQALQERKLIVTTMHRQQVEALDFAIAELVAMRDRPKRVRKPKQLEKVSA